MLIIFKGQKYENDQGDLREEGRGADWYYQEGKLCSNSIEMGKERTNKPTEGTHPCTRGAVTCD